MKKTNISGTIQDWSITDDCIIGKLDGVLVKMHVLNRSRDLGLILANGHIWQLGRKHTPAFGYSGPAVAI